MTEWCQNGSFFQSWLQQDTYVFSEAQDAVSPLLKTRVCGELEESSSSELNTPILSNVSWQQ
jgi:hypothetical protein